MRFSLSLLAVLLGVTLVGCDTFERRASQKAATFEALAPDQREKLRQGVIELGNTPDMVYIALGRPNETREKATPAGRETVWFYNSYYQEYEGQLNAGYRRFVVYDPGLRRYLVYYEPVYTDVYSEHEEEKIRVKFRDDRVVEIEQPARRPA